MKKNGKGTRIASDNWLTAESIGEVFRELDGQSDGPIQEELAKQLASKLNIDEELAIGLLDGLEIMRAYGQSEYANLSPMTAMEEVRAGIQASKQVAIRIIEHRLQNWLNQIDAENAEVYCPECGRRQESKGKRSKTWQTSIGKVTLSRRYTYCENCGQGKAPAQQILGLPSSDYTAELEEICAYLATLAPYRMAAEVLHKLLGIKVSPLAMETITERRGRQVVARNDEVGKEVQRNLEQWEQLPSVVESQPEAKPIDVAYLEMDGVYAMTRQEITARPPELAPEADIEDTIQESASTLESPDLQQAPTSEPTSQTSAQSPAPSGGRGGKGKKYKQEGKEIKNAVLYDGDSCAKESDSRGCIIDKRYVSRLGDWKGFYWSVVATIVSLGFNRANKLVILSDGAAWIREFAQQLASILDIRILLILDLFHAKHRIWEVAEVVYGKSTSEGKVWASEQCKRVEEGRATEVIQAIAFLKPGDHKAREKLEQLQTYLNNNLDRMDYPAYRAAGLRISSAAVESANYHVTGGRLKQQGMRWSEEGAAQMAALRADLFNHKWEDRTRELLCA